MKGGTGEQVLSFHSYKTHRFWDEEKTAQLMCLQSTSTYTVIEDNDWTHKHKNILLIINIYMVIFWLCMCHKYLIFITRITNILVSRSLNRIHICLAVQNWSCESLRNINLKMYESLCNMILYTQNLYVSIFV